MMRIRTRSMTLFLATLLLTSLVGCGTTAADGETAGPDAQTTATVDSEGTTETAKLTVDSTYDIRIPADADDVTRKAAELLASAFRDKAGLELAVTVEGDEGLHGIHVGTDTSDGERTYRLSFSQGGEIRLTASDSTTLYFAAEAVAEAWLSPDSGCLSNGKVYLDEAAADTLNGLPTRLDNSIRILSQNMRAADDPDGNTVQNRSARFIQMVEEYRPDLIGTQEYTNSWQIWLKKHDKKAGGSEANRVYGQVGCSRNGAESQSGEWNAILYRLDRFELLDSNTFWLSHTPDEPSVVVDGKDKRICTWAKLKDKQTGEIFVYANTHLDHTDDEVRGAQVTILMAELSEIVGDLPLYLTGDFNCGPLSGPYTIVTDTLQDAHKTAWKTMADTYGTFHDYQGFGAEIDFIFHDSHAVPVHYEVVAKQYDGYISDHYGVFVEFVH